MHKTKAFGLYTCTLCDYMFGSFYLVSMHLNTYFIFSTNISKYNTFNTYYFINLHAKLGRHTCIT